MIMADEFIRLNVVLQPPPEVTALAIGLSQRIAEKYKSEIALDGHELHPHITLYAAEYPSINSSNVFAAAEMLANKLKPLLCSLSHVDVGYDSVIGIEFKKTDELQVVHESALMQLNPLREGHVRARYQTSSLFYKSLSAEQQNYASQYGSHLVMNSWHPHLTVSVVEKGLAARIAAQDFIWPLNEFTVQALAVYTMGQYGTCRNLVASYKLAGS